MTKDLYKMTVKEAMEKGICIQCHEGALPKCYSDAGRREYRKTNKHVCQMFLFKREDIKKREKNIAY